MEEETEGIRHAALTRWLQARVPCVEPPLQFERMEGGRSNLTFLVRDVTGRQWVLRRPPLHSVLQSAHDVGREYRILTALTGSGVPVPVPIAFCDDVSVNDAPFYVMDHVAGHVVRDPEGARLALCADARHRAAHALVETLARLHAVDPDAVGLGDLGRRDAYVERQLRRWRRQWELTRDAELPEMDEAYELLQARVPNQGPATIVHGDYRIDNLILSSEGEVKAVLDWELCTLGDPLADLGMLVVYYDRDGPEPLPGTSRPTVIPGFPDTGELLEAYTRQSGRDLSGLGYYVAFGYWRLAAILQGVYRRYVDGAYGKAVEEIGDYPDIVRSLAKAAREALP